MDTVIEMGYGDGVMTQALIKNGVRPDIVEGSGVLAARAAECFPEINVKHSMFEDFVPDNPYDIVLSFHVLEHVDDVPILLSQVHKWVKVGGKVIVIVPNAESLHRKLSVAIGITDKLNELSPRDRLVGHLRVYTMGELKNDFKSAGFSIVGEFGNFIKILPNAMMLNYSQELITALCGIDEFPVHLLANIGICAVRLE